MHVPTHINFNPFFSFYESIQIKHFTGDKHICYHNQDYAPTLLFTEKKLNFKKNIRKVFPRLGSKHKVLEDV